MDKEYILNEVRRLAAENGGTPPGYEKFFKQSKIKKAYVIGNYWTKWSDVILEAGLNPANFPVKSSEQERLEKMCYVIRKIKKFPTRAEFSLLKKEDRSVPDPVYTLRILGGCKAAAEKLIEYCTGNPDYNDVLDIVIPYRDSIPKKYWPKEKMPYGSVYLVQNRNFCILDKYYKETAEKYIKIKYPMRLFYHIIQTDDPNGIYLYWRRRFYASFIHGNEYKLTKQQIDDFKLRTLM